MTFHGFTLTRSTTMTAPARPIDPPTLDDLDQAIVSFVDRYRQEHQEGPLWRELRDAVGAPRPDPDPTHDADRFQERLYALRRGGYVRFTRRRRSLEVGWKTIDA
jgi:hypothetical protein